MSEVETNLSAVFFLAGVNAWTILLVTSGAALLLKNPRPCNNFLPVAQDIPNSAISPENFSKPSLVFGTSSQWAYM